MKQVKKLLLCAVLVAYFSCSPDKTAACTEEWQSSIQTAKSQLQESTNYCPNNAPDVALCLQYAQQGYAAAINNAQIALDCCLHPENCINYV